MPSLEAEKYLVIDVQKHSEYNALWLKALLVLSAGFSYFWHVTRPLAR